MDREELILERVGLKAVQVNWAQIGEAEGQRPDDLTRIQGVDEFAQKKLNVLGIHTPTTSYRKWTLSQQR